MRACNTCPRAFIALAVLSLSVSSCDVFSGFSRPEDSGAALVRFVEPVDGTLDLSLYATTPGREAYVVFTTGYADNFDPPAATSNSVTRSAATITTDRNRGVQETASEARRVELRKLLESYRPPVASRRAISGGDPAGDVHGQPGQFILHGNDNPVTAYCRFASEEPVLIGGRSRTFSVWVQDGQWSTDEAAPGKVTPARLNALLAAFIGSTAERNESIYGWVTNMLGDEWGPEGSILYDGSPYPTIAVSENITIFLADINADGDNFITNGGVVGYFYPGDLIPAFRYSNERVMFTIDSVMFGTMDDGIPWELDDYWPREVISTLAHEFQHMIHFYQKGVLRGGDYFNEPTWIDELCSMQVEDLIADKMGVPGPRGVDSSDGTAGPPGNTSGRLREFILWPDLSPIEWNTAGDDMILSYYSWAYSFGAYLTRNYGGAEFIRNLVQSSYADERSVVAAAAMAGSGREESMTSLLRRWGVAVLLSSRMDAPEFYRYNTGQFFTSEIGGIPYNLGSINMYNYVYADGLDTDGDGTGETDLYGPYIYASLNIGDMYGGAYSNAFMTLGNPADRPDWNITVPEGMYATIVID